MSILLHIHYLDMHHLYYKHASLQALCIKIKILDALLFL